MTDRERRQFARVPALLLILVAQGAWAGNNCSASTTTFAFGTYDTLNALDATNDITITCDTGGGGADTVPYTLDLSAGSGTYASRRMTGPAATILTYNLYTDSARTLIWGDGSSGTTRASRTMVISAVGSASFIHTIYGRIPASQNVRPGAYATTSNVVATVTW